MDNKKFFDSLRNRLFKKGYSQPQVDGINSILSACIKYKVTNPHHVAHVLAHVYHETGTYMSPIKETVMPHHTNKNPSDATVINRLNNAFAKGQLSWVKTPYWRTGWFGRGQIQITHETNYRKMGNKIGVDLVKNRDLALKLENSAAIAVIGMRDGDFTGKKLSDYTFPQALNATPANHPRRIVNGVDGTDSKIREYHMHFYNSLIDAGFKGVITAEKAPTTPVKDAPSATTPEDTNTLVKALLALFKALFGRK